MPFRTFDANVIVQIQARAIGSDSRIPHVGISEADASSRNTLAQPSLDCIEYAKLAYRFSSYVVIESSFKHSRDPPSRDQGIMKDVKGILSSSFPP